MNVPPGLIRMVRDHVRDGDISIGPHFWVHSEAEGFTFVNVREVIQAGSVIEWMADRQRMLFCCRVRNANRRLVWLHVVADYSRREFTGIVTAYTPDPAEWEEPPLRRRR
jgi:hypothetical protein